MYNKKALQQQGFQTLGGRWDLNGFSRHRRSAVVAHNAVRRNTTEVTLQFPRLHHYKQEHAVRLFFVCIGVGDGIGYCASKLATSRPSLPLAAGALPKFESVRATLFLLSISDSKQVSSAMYNKKALLLQGFQTLGGRWDSNPRPSEPQSVTLTD